MVPTSKASDHAAGTQQRGKGGAVSRHWTQQAMRSPIPAELRPEQVTAIIDGKVIDGRNRYRACIQSGKAAIPNCRDRRSGGLCAVTELAPAALDAQPGEHGGCAGQGDF